MDIVSAATRSRMMSGIRSSDTKPEIQLRKTLHAWGFRYRLNAKTLGYKPDIVLPKYRMVIFAHGCFWHRHANCKYATTPGTNIDKWQIKFTENTHRDKRVEQAFLENGWRVALIWECWAKKKMDISWLQNWIKESREPFISWPTP